MLQDEVGRLTDKIDAIRRLQAVGALHSITGRSAMSHFEDKEQQPVRICGQSSCPVVDLNDIDAVK